MKPCLQLGDIEILALSCLSAAVKGCDEGSHGQRGREVIGIGDRERDGLLVRPADEIVETSQPDEVDPESGMRGDTDRFAPGWSSRS